MSRARPAAAAKAAGGVPSGALAGAGPAAAARGREAAPTVEAKGGPRVEARAEKRAAPQVDPKDAAPLSLSSRGVTARLDASRSGAPPAANHLAAGPIPLGRTTSDALRIIPQSLRVRLVPVVGPRAVDVARLHTGPAAHARASSQQARAVADGLDVFFAEGEYRPGTRGGDALIAHELTHVDQSLRGLLHRPALKAMGRAEHDNMEAAADRAGDRLTAGADVEKHHRPKSRKDKGTPAPATAPQPEGATPAAPVTPATGGAPALTPADAVAVEGEGAQKPKVARIPGSVPPELPRMPEPQLTLNTKEKARVGGVKERATATAKATAKAPSSSENVATAQKTVGTPQEESNAQAAAKVVKELIERQPPSPAIVELCNRIKRLIAEKRPPDEEAVVDSRSEEIAKEAGGQVEGDVKTNVDDANAQLDGIKQQPVGPAAPAPPGLDPMPPVAPTAQVGATAATPDAVPPANVDLEADAAEMDTKAKDAGLEEETAQLVQSGPVADAREARGEAHQLAKDGPAEALKEQKASLNKADADMVALQQQAAAALKAARAGHVTDVTTQQGGFKEGEEALKTRLSNKAAKVFTDAQKSVQDLLRPVHETAMKKWSDQEKGLPSISKRFNDDLDATKKKIKKRHSGVGGFFRGIKDWAVGLPDWVEKDYTDAEERFGDSICKLITGISSDVNTVIKACDDIIVEARRQITDIFTKDVPDGIKEWAAAQQKDFDKKLDTLHDKVQATRDKFDKELIQNAGEAVQAARERIAKLRQEAKGAWGRFLDALDKFLDDPLKFIIDGLLELVGISPKAFWDVIDKIALVIDEIAWHPIRFIGNLMDGVGAGFDLFFEHFPKHVKDGFFKWLFRGLKDLGVEVPPDFSLRSIITFFLQLMGLSWVRIRKMLADVIGEKYVAAAEKALKLVELIAKGPEGIIDLIKDKLTPEALMERVLSMAIDYVVKVLIEQVALYIIKLLNPVGAVLAAIEAIYKVCKWIFNNAAAIFHFIEAVVNALAAVVAGDTSAVAKGVEKGLAMLIPPVIDFLASLIGLGDLPEQVAKIVKGLQSWVEGIIKTIIKFLADTAKGLLASMGIGGKEEGKKDPAHIGETLTFSSEGESHKLYIDVKGTDATVMVQSSPMTVARWLDTLQERANKEMKGDDLKEALRLIGLARTQLASTDSNADAAAKASAAPPAAGAPSASGPPPEMENKVEKAEESLRDTLDKLGKMFGGAPDVVKAVAVPNSAMLEAPYTPELIVDVDETGSGAIYTSSVSDKTQIDKVVEKNPNAFDKKTGTLTLPAIQPAALKGAMKLTGIGRTIGGQTYAKKVLFNKIGGEFGVDVGFDFFARGALTGKVLLTPEKRLVDFRGNAAKAVLTATAPRYKPPGADAKPYPETSSPFQNNEYLAYFTDSRPEQRLESRVAGDDLSKWLASDGAGRGRLSRVGSVSAVTYILTKGSVFAEVVEDTEADQINQDLQKLVLDIGIVPFMKAMAQGKTLSGINFDRLNKELWPHRPNAEWLADRFRTYNKSAGMHEWIPSSSIPKTIALAASASDWVKGEKWIDLHHEMRVDTGDLIGKPAFWEERKALGKSTWAPQGHDGAIEDPVNGAQTKGFGPAGPFHTALFTNIDNCSGMSDCIAGAKKVFEQYIWNDEEPKSPLVAGLKIRGALVTSLPSLQSEQAKLYKAIITKFDGLAGKYKD